MNVYTHLDNRIVVAYNLEMGVFLFLVSILSTESNKDNPKLVRPIVSLHFSHINATVHVTKVRCPVDIGCYMYTTTARL